MPVMNVRKVSVCMGEARVKVRVRVRLPAIPCKRVFVLMMLIMAV
jgi:hypothetical protein